jgi:hypothetical protein
MLETAYAVIHPTVGIVEDEASLTSRCCREARR